MENPEETEQKTLSPSTINVTHDSVIYNFICMLRKIDAVVVINKTNKNNKHNSGDNMDTFITRQSGEIVLFFRGRWQNIYQSLFRLLLFLVWQSLNM